MVKEKLLPLSPYSSSYNYWTRKVESILKIKGLWGYTSGGVIKPESSKDKEAQLNWLIEDDKALRTIELYLSDDYLKIMKVDLPSGTSKDYWERLKEDSRDRIQVEIDRQDIAWRSLQYDGTQPLEVFLTKWSEDLARVEALGLIHSEATKYRHLVLSMTFLEHSTIYLYMYLHSTGRKASGLLADLFELAKERRNPSGKFSSSYLQAFNSAPSSSNNNHNTSNNDRDNNRDKKKNNDPRTNDKGELVKKNGEVIKCFKCGGNHFKANCSQGSSKGGDGVKQEEGKAGLAESKIDFVVSTALANHLVISAEHLSNVTNVKVEFQDHITGEVIKVEKKGDLTLGTSSEIKLKGVLVVPNARYNAISASRLTQAYGGSFLFNKDASFYCHGPAEILTTKVFFLPIPDQHWILTLPLNSTQSKRNASYRC